MSLYFITTALPLSFGGVLSHPGFPQQQPVHDVRSVEIKDSRRIYLALFTIFRAYSRLIFAAAGPAATGGRAPRLRIIENYNRPTRSSTEKARKMLRKKIPFNVSPSEGQLFCCNNFRSKNSANTIPFRNVYLSIVQPLFLCFGKSFFVGCNLRRRDGFRVHSIRFGRIYRRADWLRFKW